jgi:hypothetical protein
VRRDVQVGRLQGDHVPFRVRHRVAYRDISRVHLGARCRQRPLQPRRGVVHEIPIAHVGPTGPTGRRPNRVDVYDLQHLAVGQCEDDAPHGHQ